MEITVKMQGSLLKVTTAGQKPPPQEPPQRGDVCGFSSKSRKRLLELFASLTPQKKTVFITLTYPKEFPDAKEAKKHLRALLERIRRKAPQSSGVWRLEFQQRGAPHFHLLMWGLNYIPKEDLQNWWADIISYENPFTRIELIRSNRKVMAYVSKYVAKATKERSEASDSGFNIEPYLHAGRVWGIFQKDHLPYAEESSATSEIDPAIMLVMRAVAKDFYPALYDEYPYSGFTLFLDDPTEYVRRLAAEALE